MRISGFPRAACSGGILAVMLASTWHVDFGQASSTPLPANYKTIFENSDVLVMHVHYSPHEFLPTHDHPHYPTVFVYLTNSGEVDMKHEGLSGFTAQRQPTEAGAFRIAPGMMERHSVTSLSDTDSMFLRVELKRVPAEMEKGVFREDTPLHLAPGTRIEFQDKVLRMERILCAPDKECALAPQNERSLLIAIRATRIRTAEGERDFKAGEVIWLPAEESTPLTLSAGSHCLRVSLLYAN
jgi:hypothetical protein